ncbi:MAG: substrate-binding domain-containing protein [Bacteroidetes bacterium]|nr:substrate-binding domain-containing protein [Bacteroidota bacterium]
MKLFVPHTYSNYFRLCLPGLLFMLMFSCGSNNQNNTPQETPTSGTINISVDESFKPVMDSQIKVFESSFPNAKINVHYKSEAACFRDLTYKDSTRLIIVTRGLTEQERHFYEDSFHFIPNYGKLAYDAIAVIVNNKSKDTILSMAQVRLFLASSDSKMPQIVMDGVSATSTVRYVMDSVLRGQPLGKNVVAAKSSEDVINYVADHPKAIGFIGVSWIGNEDDPDQLSFQQKVKIAAVQCVSCLGETYVEPYQANIALKRYPMVRDVYYILKEDFHGIGNNFVNFLQYERGQLIFKRAYLWPARMSFEIRNSNITE